MGRDDDLRGLRREDEAAMQLALFRYGIIAELLERTEFDPGERIRLVAKLAQREYYLPGRGPIRLSTRTIYAWLARARRGGIDELLPRRRKDRGARKALKDSVLTRAIELRKEVPARHTSTLLDIMIREGTISAATAPHRSTLDRHLARRGASRRAMAKLGHKRTIKMVHDEFGDLWVGDYKHGPLVLDAHGKLVTSKLGAFIDHATRYPVSHRFYLSEQLDTLRDTFS